MFQILLLRLGRLLLKLKRPNLRKWAILEDKRKCVINALGNNSPDLQKYIEEYFFSVFGFSVNLSNIFWVNSMEIFFICSDFFVPKIEIPLLKNIEGSEKHVLESWEYSGRTWYWISNLFAKSYGWSLNKIEKLNVNDAFALLQEILVDEQLEKEFLWARSDVAYKYDKVTKKSTLIKLNRPNWMKKNLDIPSESNVTRMPKSLLPIGNAVDLVHAKKNPKNS